MKKMAKLLSVVLASLMVLTACGGSVSSSSQPVSASVAESSSASLAQAEGVMLVDQAGREVEIAEEPAKLVSGYYITTTTMMAMGLTDKLVGIEAKADSRPIYKLAAPQLLELPNVGTAKEFDVEGTIALEPDLVMAPARIKDSADTLSTLGIPVVLVSPESHDEYLEMVALIGKATQAEEAADKLIAYYNSELTEVKEQVAAIEEKPVVYMGGNSSYLSTAPKDMYQASLIDMAGAVNAADALEGDNWMDISYEQLLEMNPDVIVIPSLASYTKEDVLNDAELSQLAAVQQGNVYTMPGFVEAWDSPGPAATLGLRWMVYALHEDVYTKEELDEKVSSFYDEFYGVKELDLTQVTK